MCNFSEKDKILILDFSGTLSLDSVLYGRSENLKKELKESGLQQIGVRTPELFWEEIVNPIWEQGSTTDTGYKEALFEKVVEILPSFENKYPLDYIRVCASKFVNRYFSSSKIEQIWRNVLVKLISRQDTIIVVATDHYAEATEHIINQLEALNLVGVPISSYNSEKSEILVANSADIGFRKTNKNFWITVKNSLKKVNDIKQIVIVDDFGYNEPRSDDYSQEKKIRSRMNLTVHQIAEVFDIDVNIFPFFIESKEEVRTGIVNLSKYNELVSSAQTFIERSFFDSQNI